MRAASHAKKRAKSASIPTQTFNSGGNLAAEKAASSVYGRARGAFARERFISRCSSWIGLRFLHQLDKIVFPDRGDGVRAVAACGVGDGDEDEARVGHAGYNVLADP